MKGSCRRAILDKIYVNIPFALLSRDYLSQFIRMRINPEIGFDAIVLNEYPAKEFRRVARELQEEGLLVNLHAPFMDLAPGSSDPSILALTRQRFDQMGDLAATFGAKGVVYHAGYDRRRYGFMKDSWMERACETWSVVITLFRNTDTLLLLENVYEYSPEDLLPLFTAFRDEEMGFCLDTGHQSAFSDASLDAWVQVLGPFLRHLHLHDNRGEEDEHLALGRGSIDFRSLFRSLRAAVPITPNLTLEPHTEGDLWPSIEYLERIWQEEG